MSNSLEEAIRAAIPTVERQRKERSARDPLVAWVHRHHPSLPHTLLEPLIEALQGIPGAEIFDEKMWVIANSASRVSYESLAGWLAAHSADVGIAQAIEDIHTYLRDTTFPCYEVLALGGVSIPQEIDLGANLSLVPLEAIPDSYAKFMLLRSDPLGLPVPTPTAGLLRYIEHPKVHLQSGERIPDIPGILTGELEDARLCLTLAGPCSTVRFGTWFSAPESVPLAGASGAGLSLGIESLHTTTLSVQECQRARESLASFRRLSPDQQAHIRIPLTHLNAALKRQSLVVSAIEVRVALESLLLDDLGDDRGELTFRLRLRAARLLEKDLLPRKRLWTLFGDLYRIGSIAVHTGKIGETYKSQFTTDILEQGYKELARGVESWMASGDINWLDMILS